MKTDELRSILGQKFHTIRFDEDAVEMIDQRLLPAEYKVVTWMERTVDGGDGKPCLLYYRDGKRIWHREH